VTVVLLVTGGFRVVTDVTIVGTGSGTTDVVGTGTGFRVVTDVTAVGTGGGACVEDCGGSWAGCEGWVGGAAGAPERAATAALKSAVESLAVARLKSKGALFWWKLKLLDALFGVATARVLIAQARRLTPEESSSPPDHLLQPVQRKLAVQCVELTAELE